MTDPGRWPTPPDRTQAIAAIQQRFNTAVLPSWPVYELAVPTGRRGWLSGIAETSEGLCSVRIDYRPPGTNERLIVQSQLLGKSALDLVGVLEQLRQPDEGEPLSVYGSAHGQVPARVPVIVDGTAVDAMTLRAEPCQVWAVLVSNVLVVIASRGTAVGQVAVDRLTDLTRLKDERSNVVGHLLAD